MATDNTVSFKVFLTKRGSTDQPEARRFGIDRDVVSNFSYLREKLQMIFPSLNGKNFTVHWKDSDSDNIIITSDEELIIALTEMQTDVRKLYVVLEPTTEQDRRKPQDTPAQQVHTGVTCDGCQRPVQGFRYKCVQCPDFDLCSFCEAENLHGEHFMIRAPVPISWRPHFGRRLAHHLHKSARKEGASCDSWAPKSPCGQPSPSFCPYRPRSHRGRYAANHNDFVGHNWLGTLSNYLSDWSNLPGEAETPNAGDATTERAQSEQEQQQHNFLKTVGQTVAQLLDPLGIDVDVEVRPKMGTDENVKSSATDQSNKEKNEPATDNKHVSFADNIHETAIKEVANKVNDMTIDDKTEKSSGHSGAIPKATTTNVNMVNSPESEGWTVVNEVGVEQGASARPSVPPSATLTQDPSTSRFFEAAHQIAHFAAAQLMTPGPVAPAAVAADKVNEEATKTFDEAAHYAAHQRAIAEAHKQAQHAQQAAWAAMAASGNNNIYPNLRQQAPPGQAAHHPQPHITTAVQQMMSMGFTNEGGWLSQLVETQNGDIAKVLDVLQPHKK